MLTFRFFGADGVMTVPEKLTTGMLGKQIKLEFSTEWDDLTKTAVFSAGDVSIAVHGVGELVTIPAEVLLVPMQRLYIGIYGELSDGTLVIPTIYARGPRIERGADPYGAVAGDPPMPKWKELEDRIDRLEDNGCTGGTTDHSKLSNRDAADQHPIESIKGLREKLDDLETGSSGIHVGADEPTDDNIVVWIDPESEDTSLLVEAPATAKVGQTIVVKSVDENGTPVAWEAADLPDSYTKSQIDTIMGAYINDIDALIGGDS